MATLNVNNHLLTIYSNHCNFVLNINNKNFTKLRNVPSVNKLQSSEDPYLGLTRYCATLSHNGKWYVVAEERNLIVWSTSSLEQYCTKSLERSASQIIFTPSDQSLLVADKTGDVYLFSLSDTSALKGSLILGHLSILLDITMTLDEKYIITCDRDEKIRVTCYPNTYNIKSFCLGHSAFVTKILLIDNNVLMSGSGDGNLKFWNFLEGVCISTYSVYGDIKDEFPDPVSQCIITNIAISNHNDDKIICLSVHKFNGVLVYKCDSNINLTLVQKVDCYEPLDFVLYEHTLWILKPLNDRVLSALLWDENTGCFSDHTSEHIKRIISIVDSEYSSLINCCYSDLSVLYKKFHLKEKSKLEKGIENPVKKLKIR